MAASRKTGFTQRLEGLLLESPRKRNLVICLALAIVTLALYSPVVGYPFIFNYDDSSYVGENAHVQAGLVRETILWALKSTEYSNWHPLTWLSHALDCQLYGLNPTGHHVTNLLLHALNVLLLFLLLVRATGFAGRSFLVAALFAIHPLNVESVAWIAERKNVLSTFFFLLTLGAYGWYSIKPGIKRYLAVAALFVLGLASKPMVITLPCVLLLLDFWPLRRFRAAGQPPLQEQHVFVAQQASRSRLVLEKLPLFALSAASGAVTISAQRSGGSMHLILPAGVRLENAIYAYAMYVWKTLGPTRLAVFYPHPGATLRFWQLGLATLFVVSVSVLAWQQRTARPYLATGWLWFLGTLVPVIGLVQVGEQAMADRYAYVPLIGIFLMAVWGAADLADRRQLSSKSRTKTAVIVLGILVLFTCDQIRYWRSSADLWLHAVKVTKDNFFAEENLGAALMAADRAPEALPYLQDAIHIRPADPAGHLNLAGVFALTGRPRDAISQYETAVTGISDPHTLVAAYETMGRLYGELGNYSQARASYQQALRIDPQQQSASEGLAGVELSNAFRNAAESPSGAAYLQLGRLLQQAGRVPEAHVAYEQAFELDPKNNEVRKALDAMNGQGK